MRSNLSLVTTAQPGRARAAVDALAAAVAAVVLLAAEGELAALEGEELLEATSSLHVAADSIRAAAVAATTVVDERDAARRALSMLALPLNAALGLKLLYRMVDAMWYAAGDTSVDFNFYTKRATLAGVYSATLLYWLNDRTEGGQGTWDFLDRRLDDVMRIEKIKSQVRAWPGARTRAGAVRR